MSASRNPAAPSFYETFRTSGGRLHHWRFNHARLMQACTRARLAIPPSFLAANEERLQLAVRELLRRFEVDNAVFRYAITAGENIWVPPAFRADPAAPDVTEELTSRPLPLPAPPRGIALRLLRVRREPDEWHPRPKRSHAADLRLASEEIHARAVASSDEGLMLSREGGLVVETSRQNIFWVSGDTVFYPDPAVGSLGGTCFAWLLENGLAAQPVRAPLDTLLAADAVAVCNAVRGVTPVSELWDIADRACLRTYESASHPLLLRLAVAWRSALARTATGTP